MEQNASQKPLADRLRPQNWDHFFGQEKILKKSSFWQQSLAAGRFPSLIIWGPPGTGKTSLAHIIAQQTKSVFYQMSAVVSGIAELKKIVQQAEEQSQQAGKVILFIDEIHRWNKAQQDALLPYVEKGVITLIGATTENPSFAVVSPLLSRCQVLVLERLAKEDLEKIIDRALNAAEAGVKIKLAPTTKAKVAELANGDARAALNILEMLDYHFAKSTRELSLDDLQQVLSNRKLYYDKNGEEHYNIISALHKSLRGSDADAALYWLFRMLEAGEDPLYIARRLIRFASEDVGLANSLALPQAVAAYQSCQFIGLPECEINLAQAVVYLAKCKKSNELYVAINKVKNDVQETLNEPVPLHLRNAPTKLMKNLGYGKDYQYSPDHDYQEKQDYLPASLHDRHYLSQ